jgi:hypothetical protein
MVPSLDIFKISGGGVLWRDAVATLETAKARIRKLALSSPGEYFILDQNTGQRVFVTPTVSGVGRESGSTILGGWIFLSGRV